MRGETIADAAAERDSLLALVAVERLMLNAIRLRVHAVATTTN